MSTAQAKSLPASIQLLTQLPSLFRDKTQSELRSVERVVLKFNEDLCQWALQLDEARRKKMLWDLAESGITEPPPSMILDLYYDVLRVLKSVIGRSRGWDRVKDD